jgi:O-succinylbenzoic acid--CoA ligase
MDLEGEWSSGMVDHGDDWGILFTSGTSGTPRGAAIPLGAMFATAVASAFHLGTLPDDRWLLAMPLYHIGGLAIVIRCCLYGTAVVLQDGFDPGAVWTALDRDRVTLISLVPTMLRRLLDCEPDRPAPDVLRLALVGGAAAPEELVGEALARGWPLALTYGLTEAVSQVATALPAAVRRKPGSVGKALFGIRLRIAVPAAHGGPGDALPPGASGEIFVSGTTLMRGYLGEPPVGEWLATGDIGCLDEDGDLFLLERRTDLIVSGGENVYPAEIERVLRTHPGIREACVVGIEDAEWGRRVAAAVVPKDRSLTVKEIEAYLRPRIAGYKLPREILLLDELPCTASGKVCRPDVVKLFIRDQGA